MKYYSKTKIGDSSTHPDPKVKRGWSLWIENGVWFTAPTVNRRRFGSHAYGGEEYDYGLRECSYGCQCHMGSSSSGGPVDPFGACPLNPLKGAVNL